jgi:hypothetical protein
LQPIRTAATIHLKFEIHSPFSIPQSEFLREKIIELHRLGMKKQAIADRLGTTRRTVRYSLAKFIN